MPRRVIPGSITKPYEKREGDFSPNLVGNQSTNGNSFFTFGNFSLTTNNSDITGEFLNTGEFSDIITLDSLQITEEDSKEINKQTNNLEVKLKTNPNKLQDYVYFSDARKFIETEVVDILNKWKGGLYIQFSYINDTVTDFTYNSDKNTSYFTISKNILINPFNIVTDNIPELATKQNDISFIQNAFKNYQITNEYGNYAIISYTGNTETDDYIKLETEGLAWPTLISSATTSGSFEYYLKPNNNILDKLFFSKLSPFQEQLLNQESLPKKYTISLSKQSDTAFGQPVSSLEKFTWPTSDDYNLAYDGRDYGQYIEKLFRFAAYFDSEITNVMVRRLVAKAIFEFDTPGDGTNPKSGQKMDKLMKIWGREYDKIKTYIDSISFANVITYDGIENTPDELIKLMASNLGFDTIQSFSDNNLLKFFQKTQGGVFNKQQTNMSLSEMDREFWRRLVINAWWLFKSKGTRKVIEFFLNFFNINECLVTFDEIVYVAENKLNYPALIRDLLNYYGFIPPDETIASDVDGFPKILPNTNNYYFQLNGFWYDGGVEPNTKPDLKGNNPHFGPYDFGKAYFEKYTCLITNFEPIDEIVNLNALEFNYFTDYSLGTVEGTGQVIVEGNNIEATTNIGVGNILNSYNPFYAETMNQNGRIGSGVALNAGLSDETSNNGLSSFHINFISGDRTELECLTDNCPDIQLSDSNNPTSGLITYVEQNGIEYVLEDEECCQFFGFNNYFNTNDGTTPCYWCPPFDAISIVPFNNGDEIVNILVIIKPDGTYETPTEACCTLRNGEWITPESIGSNNELILGKPYCKSGNAGGPLDPETNEDVG